MVPIISELDDAAQEAEVPASPDYLHHDRSDRILWECCRDDWSGITQGGAHFYFTILLYIETSFGPIQE